MSMTPHDRRCRRCGTTEAREAELLARPAGDAEHFCEPCGEELGAGGRAEYLRLSLLAA